MAEPVAWLDQRAERDALALAGSGEDEFRDFYAQTARPLLVYLRRLTGNAGLAEDLLQESYLRILKIGLPEMDAAQRKSYLYRTATNLVRDHYRSKASRTEALAETATAPAVSTTAQDVRAVLGQIPGREQEILWLAYAEGFSHREIAGVTGLKEQSIRPMLYKARQKMAGLLRAAGFSGRCVK